MHCYTQTVIIKLITLALILTFPATIKYQRLIWNYKKADSKNIRKALDLVNQERLFDQKDTNAQAVAFTETILIFFRYYVPNKYITVDDKGPVCKVNKIT